ncbi:MlaD family protein [Nocardia sp. NBC_00565]|uniref:MlaD family protein n=1 Tax=Nocardia sp. NBC_00565 TaxID=2975993 RepID=UPI002E800CE9|nr:MlaD family protein [Nocardia sp. NBC_00565]WUC05568.1 MlaD family protein [Nocardia sp. NBC_00565]
MKASTGTKAILAVAISAGVMFASASCAVEPNDVPLPGNNLSDGYDLTLHFASALNLPDRAKVVMDGLRIGEVRTISLSDGSVTVTARIESAARIPANVTAIIRQDTLLGDTYVGLERDRSRPAAELLPAGSTVPLERTSSPPQVEDVMAVLANFVNGGSVQKVQDAIVGINRVMPSRPDVTQLARTVAVDLHDLSQRTETLDRMLEGLNATAVSVTDNGSDLAVLFGDPAVQYWRRLNENVLKYVGILLPSIGSIFEGGFWLVPLFTSLADAAGSIRATAEDVPADAEALSNFVNRTLVPFLRNPSVNVTSIQTQQGDDLTAGIANVLRILGAAR